MGISEGKEKEKETQEISGQKVMMAENNSKLLTDTKPQIQEAQRILSQINSKISTHTPIISKLKKIRDKEKILKEARKKKKPYL